MSSFPIVIYTVEVAALQRCKRIESHYLGLDYLTVIMRWLLNQVAIILRFHCILKLAINDNFLTKKSELRYIYTCKQWVVQQFIWTRASPHTCIHMQVMGLVLWMGLVLQVSMRVWMNAGVTWAMHEGWHVCRGLEHMTCTCSPISASQMDK